MKTIPLILFTLCFCLSLQAQNEVKFLWDKNASSIAFAENTKQQDLLKGSIWIKE